MGREDQIIGERLKKLKSLRAEGVNPYPAKADKEQDVASVLKAKQGSKVSTAGRLMSKRALGKITFSQLRDVSGDVQLVLQKGETPEKVFSFFKTHIDAGDFIRVQGKTIKTKTGEFSILVGSVTLLTKSILPLPEKWHGIKDEEERYRKRYVDFLVHPELKDIFIKKAQFWQTTRSFLVDRGFLEVETPVLEASAGGAAATPFVTHHNALDMDVYLRISMGELWQKRLMVAGFEKTFEIGRQFRNEGMDREHLQDYTQMEFYWAYADYEMGMALVEELYKTLAKNVFGTTKFTIGDHQVDLATTWERYDYETLIKEKTGISIYSASATQIKQKLKSLKVKFDDSVDKWRLVDVLWKYCRRQLAGPGFLVNQPVELAPLAKRQDGDERKVQQFQVIIAGSEMGNGYSELNDPLDQEERFEEQAKLKEAGDAEAQDHDKDFVEALKYGMPPTCGFGFSERLFSFLANKPIRECVTFPLLKPKDVPKKKTKKK